MFDYNYVYVVSYKSERKKFRMWDGALKLIEEYMKEQEDFPITITVEVVLDEEYQKI